MIPSDLPPHPLFKFCLKIAPPHLVMNMALFVAKGNEFHSSVHILFFFCLPFLLVKMLYLVFFLVTTSSFACLLLEFFTSCKNKDIFNVAFAYLYANKEIITRLSCPFVHLSACSFSSTIELFWSKFRGLVLLDPVIPQF